jgi:hypothetical protein
VHHRVIGQGMMTRSGWIGHRPSAARLAEMLARGPGGAAGCAGQAHAGRVRAAQQCRARFGERSIGNYIVAAHGRDDLLAPLVLARWAGVDDRRSGAVGMDFAPCSNPVTACVRANHAGRAGQCGLLRAPGGSARAAVRRLAASAATWVSGDAPAAYDAQRELANTLAAAGQSR